MERTNHREDLVDEAGLEDLPVTSDDAAEVLGAGLASAVDTAAPPGAGVGQERDGYRASAGSSSVEARRRDGSVEYEATAGNRRVEGRVD